MAKKQSRGKSKDNQHLEELIARSVLIRKNIDSIMTAFRKIEKHINTIQKGLNERRARQHATNTRLDELIKNIKEFDESIKVKGNK